MDIGKLEKVPLREIWRKEEKDFSSWLESNIEYLNEALDLNLSSIEAKKKAGTFMVDLLAEDTDGSKVIIENQLEKTDHDHLGKVLTYLTNLEAKTAIWICSYPRPEHIKAVTWLNETTPEDISFYLIKVEGVRIGDSPPAPLFSVICEPSEEAKEVGKEKQEFAERHRKHMEFWKILLEGSKKRTKLFAGISPGKYHWIGTGAGKSGLSLNFVITTDWGSAELYIDKGKDSEEINKKVFNSLYKKKNEIENKYGEKLLWESLEGRRACRIRAKFDDGGIKNIEKWELIQEKMIDAMIRLEKALKPHIAKLAI